MNLRDMEQELRDKSNNLINDLSKEEVEKYIQVLTKNYYESYLSGNSKKFNDNFRELKNLIGIVEGYYPNIKDYTNYCLLCNINSILENNLKVDIDLIVFGSSIDETEVSKIDMTDDKIFEYDLKLLKSILDEGND